MRSTHTSHLALLCIVAIVFCWSGWRPHDRFTWWLEVSPGLAGIINRGRLCAPAPFLFHDRAIRNIADSAR